MPGTCPIPDTVPAPGRPGTIRRATTADLVLLLATVSTWAGAFVAIKVAVPALGAVGVAAVRAGLGALVVLPFALHGGLVLPPARTLALLFVLAQLNVTLPFVAISWAEQTIDAGATALLMGTGPFFAMIGAHLALADERMTRWRAGGAMLGFAGVATLVGGEGWGQLMAGHIGAYGATLFASLCYVAAGLLVRRIDMRPVLLALYTLALAALVLFPAVAVVGWGEAAPTSQTWLAVAFLGLLPTGLAYVLRYHLIQRIGYATFALGINLIPVLGVLFGVILLGEALTARIVLALSLVLAGLFVARLSP